MRRKANYLSHVAMFVLFFVIATSCWAESLQYLFKSGTEAYTTFRIPALVISNKGIYTHGYLIFYCL